LQVEVTSVVQKDVPLVHEWIATVDGSVNAEIRPQVEGYVLRQAYREGFPVKRGQLLFQIDPRPFEAAAEQAKAALAREQATFDKARLDVDRYAPLAAQKAISQQELDNANAARNQAQASMDAAQAAYQRARLNLEWTRVVSPIDGIVGMAKAQVGNLVNGQTVMTTVSTVDPVKVLFSANEAEYMAWAHAWSAKGGGKGILQLVLSDGSLYPHKGDPYMTDRNLDTRTGTIALAGLFANPDQLLRPGQYAKVRATLGVAHDALLVPQRAVWELQGTFQVAVVGPDDKVDIRPVRLGAQAGPLVAVEQGVKAQERVVVEGVQKVTPGMTVRPVLAAR
jgi:membrane fusion protein (multidrug efflux system)